MSQPSLQTSGKFSGQPYQLEQATYARRYGKPVRTIRRWQEQGRPLDDPDAMGKIISPLCAFCGK